MGVSLLDGLKFYYACDEASGTRFDSGPNGLHVPVVGAVGSVAGALGLGVGGTGNIANYLEAAHDDRFRPVGAFTLSYWHFIPAGTLTENHPAVAHVGPGANDFSYRALMRNAVDRHSFEVSPDGTGAAIVRVDWGAAPVVDTWQHVLCVFDPDAGLIKISVDGGAFVTAAFAGPIFAATAPFGITSSRGSTHLVGLGDVDEIAGYDRVLNPDEHAYLEGGGTPPEFSTFSDKPIAHRLFTYYYT